MINLSVPALIFILVFVPKAFTNDNQLNSSVAYATFRTIQPLESLFHFSPRIVNGENAQITQIPYQVYLQIVKPTGLFLCGGSLLSSQWILTAAHCTTDARIIFIYLGITNISQSKKTIRDAETIIVNPNYDPNEAESDVSLIKLNETVRFTSNIKPIRLPTSNSGDYAGAIVVASGWGLNNTNGGNVQENLQAAPLQVISNIECEQTFGRDVLNSTILCAKGLKRQSVCSGDSGGPLATSGRIPVLVGVSSFVHISGCDNGLPQGFQRVTLFLPWIKNVTGII